MMFLIYLWMVLPHTLLLCWWYDRWLTFVDRERANGISSPTWLYIKSMPRRLNEWFLAFGDSFYWGGM